MADDAVPKVSKELLARAERLLSDVLAPLVLGGEVHLSRPFGPSFVNAMLSGPIEPPFVDVSLLSHVDVARVRSARALAPVDVLRRPTREELALGSCLSDLLLATHPDFSSAIKRRSRARLIELTLDSLGRIPPPASVGEALSRHTLFSRIGEVRRTDFTVRFWVGTRRFLGRSPPSRLTLWPKLRQVHVEEDHLLLKGLVDPLPLADAPRIAEGLARVLDLTPLTQIATLERPFPPFSFTPHTLSFLATRGGTTLASRALRGTGHATHAVLSRALADNLGKPKTAALFFALLPFLGELVFHALSAQPSLEASLAAAAGALALLRGHVAAGTRSLGALRPQLEALAMTPAGREVANILDGDRKPAAIELEVGGLRGEASEGS